MYKMLNVSDIMSVAFGALISAVLFSGDLAVHIPGLPAAFPASLAVHGIQAPALVLALALLTWPLARRFFGLVCDPRGAAEYRGLAREVRRCGLMHRVRAMNIHLAGVPDRHWTNVFATDSDLWNWLGEAFQDRGLRAQMHPDVAARAERAGRAIGALT